MRKLIIALALLAFTYQCFAVVNYQTDFFNRLKHFCNNKWVNRGNAALCNQKIWASFLKCVAAKHCLATSRRCNHHCERRSKEAYFGAGE